MCQHLKKITLCTCAPKVNVTTHNKKSRRHKQKEEMPAELRWYLSRYVGHFEPMMEGEVALPVDKLDEVLTSPYLLAELNTRNCFDFDFEPIEGDNLSLRKGFKFISFIYQGSSWELGFYDTFSQKTILLKQGNIKIILD